MQKLIEGVNQIQEVMEKWDGWIINVSVDTKRLGEDAPVRVHVYHTIFKEVVEELELQPYQVKEEDSNGTIVLTAAKDGVEFFTRLNEHEFEAEFRSWLYDEPFEDEVTDEEFLTEERPSALTENEYAMKLAGHKLHDFM